MQQKLGLAPLTAMVVGNLVGSGVFLLPVTLAKYGSISMLGWLFTAIGAIFLALVFAVLSQYETKIGGPQTYVRAAFGKEMEYYTGFGYWCLSWISNAALVIGAAGYISIAFDGLDQSTILAVEISIIVVIALLNCLSIKAAGQSELIMTIIKVIPLILLPLAGVFVIDVNNFFPINRSGQSIPEVLNSVGLIALWSFIGLETATVPGAQVKNPHKSIAVATIIGTLLAALIYMLGTTVIMGVVPYEDLIISQAPYADAAKVIFGGNWGVIIAFIAFISCIGALNGWTMVVARIIQGLAADKLFPSLFAKTNSLGAPIYGVIISSFLTCLFILGSSNPNAVDHFNVVIQVSVNLVLVIYLLCVLSFFTILMRKQELYISRIFIGIGALSFVIWALIASDIKSTLLSLTILLLGMPMRLFMKTTNKIFDI